MAYVDGYLLVVPKKNVKAYSKMAKAACKVWRKHGALEFRECVGDDLNAKFGMPFPKVMKLKKGETVFFSWVVYKSRAARDACNAKVMKDPVILKMMKVMSDPKKRIHDHKRMAFGGFKVLVES